MAWIGPDPGMSSAASNATFTKENRMFDKLKGKVEELAGDHPDQAESVSDKGIDAAGNLVDKGTGGKFDGQIDKGETIVDGKIGNEGR